MSISILSSQIFESIFKYDGKFDDIIYELEKHNNIARKISSMYGKDIKTSQNYIKTSDKNDEIKSVNDTQVDRIISAKEDPFDKKGNIIKIGRFVRQLLDLNDIKFTDQEIEEFVNLYKNLWDLIYNPESQISIVSGEKIRWAYNESNYVTGGGTLNNSCMKHNGCQKFLDIYVENVESCQLVVFMDLENKIRARALLWKCDKSKYDIDYWLDRIYTRHDRDAQTVINFVKSKFKDFKVGIYQDGGGLKIEVKLIPKEYDYYPYLDSIYFYYPTVGLLSNQYDKDSDENDMCFELRATDGSKHVLGYVFSKYLNKYIREINSVWSRYEDDYLPEDLCVLTIGGDSILKNKSLYSDLYKVHIPIDMAIETEWGIASSDDMSLVLMKSGDIKSIPNIFSNKKFIILSNSDRGFSGAEVGLTFRDIFYHNYLISDQDKFIKMVKVEKTTNFRIIARVYYNGYREVFSFQHPTKKIGSIPVGINHYGFFISEDDSNIFSISTYNKGEENTTAENTSIQWIPKKGYMDIFYSMEFFNYNEFISTLSSLRTDTNSDAVDRKIDLIEKRHILFMENSSTYRTKYLSSKVFANKDYLKYFNELYQSKFKEPDYGLISNNNFRYALHDINRLGIFNIDPKSSEFNPPFTKESIIDLLNGKLKIFILQLQYWTISNDSLSIGESIMMKEYPGIFIPRFDDLFYSNSYYEIVEFFHQKIRSSNEETYIKWNSCFKYLKSYPMESFNDWYNNYYLPSLK